jgi:hypothetical protein
MPEAPSLVATGSRLYLIANAVDSITFGRTDVYVSMRESGAWSAFANISASGLPSTRAAAVVSQGAVHVVWGERTTPHPADTRPDMVLYANNGGGVWSAPEVIFSNPGAVFGSAPGFAADMNGSLHMVVDTRDSISLRSVVVSARRSGGTWSEPRAITSTGGQAAVADAGGWLALGFIRPAVPDAGSVDVNSVFSMRSEDDGETWRDTTLVSRSGLTPASAVVVLATEPGRIHLIWLQDRNGDIYPEAIMHSDSPDGIVWSTPGVVAEPGSGVQSFRAAADRFGRLHLVYQHSAGGGFPPSPPMRGFYTQWTGTSWSVPVQLFDWEALGQVIAIAVSPLDSLHIAANVRDYGSVSDIYLASAYVGDSGR